MVSSGDASIVQRKSVFFSSLFPPKVSKEVLLYGTYYNVRTFFNLFFRWMCSIRSYVVVEIVSKVLYCTSGNDQIRARN